MGAYYTTLISIVSALLGVFLGQFLTNKYSIQREKLKEEREYYRSILKDLYNPSFLRRCFFFVSNLHWKISAIDDRRHRLDVKEFFEELDDHIESNITNVHPKLLATMHDIHNVESDYETAYENPEYLQGSSMEKLSYKLLLLHSYIEGYSKALQVNKMLDKQLEIQLNRYQIIVFWLSRLAYFVSPTYDDNEIEDQSYNNCLEYLMFLIIADKQNDYFVYENTDIFKKEIENIKLVSIEDHLNIKSNDLLHVAEKILIRKEMVEILKKNLAS